MTVLYEDLELKGWDKVQGDENDQRKTYLD